ncbi:MAG: hypothetical protein IPK60_13925 [Sandaracinaceae bacterium]|nr:hypothetical protein [Sandaracinaceae bacterium]
MGSFSRDELGLDAFEERINHAYERATPEELFALVADLKTPEAALPIRVRVENPQAESAPGPSAASCSTFAT